MRHFVFAAFRVGSGITAKPAGVGRRVAGRA
jgi:hypothetical protein